MLKMSHTETVAAPATSIWSRWTNVGSWPQYDETLASASIDGAFELGHVITVKPKKAPKMKFVLALVTPDVGFAMIARLPLGTLRFTHHLEEKNGSTIFTQTVAITGPLFWLYAPFFAPSLERNLIARMKNLATLVTQPSE